MFLYVEQDVNLALQSCSGLRKMLKSGTKIGLQSGWNGLTEQWEPKGGRERRNEEKLQRNAQFSCSLVFIVLFFSEQFR